MGSGKGLLVAWNRWHWDQAPSWGQGKGFTSRDRQDQGGERSQRESKVRERIMERPQRAEPSKSRGEGTEKVTATGQREISAAHWNF